MTDLEKAKERLWDIYSNADGLITKADEDEFEEALEALIKAAQDCAEVFP